MKKYLILIAFLNIIFSVSAQENYPKIAGYVGIVHPIATFTSAGTDFNFDGHYVVGMPLGINLWKSKSIGFSFEVVPYIRAENGTSKMSNLLIHPGVLVSLGNGYTFAGRLAFETSGRYGFTPVLNKVIIKNKSSSFFAAVPVPFRFGNDRPFSATVAFQFGLAF
jgi:hypothetical protein